MQLCIEKLDNMERYFLYIRKSKYGPYGVYVTIDSQIAKILGLNIKQYILILKKFNAFKSSDGDYYFNSQKDIENAKEYLDDNYITILKLRGE